jgi:hypothetical protein
MSEFTTREATVLGTSEFLAGNPVTPAQNEAFMLRLRVYAASTTTKFGYSLPLMKAFTSAWLSAHHKAVGVAL